MPALSMGLLSGWPMDEMTLAGTDDIEARGSMRPNITTANNPATNGATADEFPVPHGVTPSS